MKNAFLADSKLWQKFLNIGEGTRSRLNILKFLVHAVRKERKGRKNGRISLA
jgi:hypothetical protein